MKATRVGARWSAFAAALLVVGGSTFVVGAAGGSEDGSVLVPTVPQRVLDTREAGAQFATLGPASVGKLDFSVLVPAGADAVDLNVTITDGSQPSFLTVWPSGAPQPNASVLNWLDGTPDANALAVRLGDGQAIDIANRFGTVDVVVDMMGYYVEAPAGERGPAGPQGPQGAEGAKGAKGDTGVADVETVTMSAGFVANVANTVTATCPPGKSVLSGGFEVEIDIDALTGALSSGPVGGDSWEVSATSSVDQDISASAVCASVATG